MMEEVKEVVSTLSVHGPNIKVTEVLKDGDTLTFLVVSQKLSGTGEYHVGRTYEDFEWLQQHLFSQEDEPGIQGVIFPSLPAKAQVNASPKVMKQLGFLGLGEWLLYCKALESFLQQIAAHSILSRNKAVEIFLTSSDPPGRQRVRKNIFNRLSQAVEERRKEGHKDVDEFFQTERHQNLVLTGCTRTAAEVSQPPHGFVVSSSRFSSLTQLHTLSCVIFALLFFLQKFLDVVQSEQKIAVAYGHFSASLHLCVEPGEDPDKQAFSNACMKLSKVFDSMKKNMTSVAENNMNTLGLGLDLESRCQEAEKEMLFRRTCKLVELETARRNAEKAKPLKKAAMEEAKKALETEFDHICGVAKQEVARFQAARVEMLQQALVQWCEKQLLTAKESADQFNQHLQAFRGMA
ncbi:sorting nexin-6 isoform X1 [Pseudoliparis swirei]|uniref:sorting nexin-6 isoform X1 n=1 Tax=Pseudoliparis swirei TaxID=2059687 RepID=UPI0024BD8110|nr:sorting nexin-6 isoform X1 [Pseudoliparis swirei]XP_056293825.1 sorting nexin-6 isoform X1 [Pseudoliparis swirei]